MSGVVYNPDLQTREELLQTYVARPALLERLAEDLRSGQPQHHLIVGQRGMGKTTLLRRLALEVERDPALSQRWLALTFPEEQYNIGRLSDLWLNCLDALADALEHAGERAEVDALDAFIHSLPTDEAPRAELALDRLLTFARDRRGLVLCIDNVDQLFDRLESEQWTIREVLGAEDRLVFVGASVAPLEAAFRYDAAFYDFFEVHWLKGLDLDETRTVVRALAERDGQADVIAQMEARPARLRALHVLTGGNPRTVVLLYQVLARDPHEDVRVQLERLLDQVTPLYKARVEALPEQGQRVLDALATAWDPATASDIAASTRLDVNAVSTQLHRLHQQGIVDKVELPEASRLGFQVSERFFNVWYLMRASRRHRQRLLSLAKCLEVLYGIEDLEALASQVMTTPSEADFCLAVAKALPDGGMQRALFSTAIDQVLGNPKGMQEFRALLGEDDGQVRDLADRKERVRAALEAAKDVDWEALGIERDIGEVIIASIPAVMRIVGSPVARLLAYWVDMLRELLGVRTWRVVHDAICRGDLATAYFDEWTEMELDAVSHRAKWPPLGISYRLLNLIRERHAVPAELVSEARESGDDGVLRLLASAEGVSEDLENAALDADAAIEIAPNNHMSWAIRWEVALASGDTALANHAAVHAAALGNERALFLATAWMQEDDPSRERELAVRLLRTPDPEASRSLRRLARNFSKARPDDALRFWRRAAELEDPLEHMDDLVKVLRGLILADRGQDALSLVDTPDLREKARPLYAAMSAVAANNPEQLRAFAPEVAGPARELLDALWPESERPEPPKSRKKRPR